MAKANVKGKAKTKPVGEERLAGESQAARKGHPQSRLRRRAKPRSRFARGELARLRRRRPGRGRTRYRVHREHAQSARNIDRRRAEIRRSPSCSPNRRCRRARTRTRCAWHGDLMLVNREALAVQSTAGRSAAGDFHGGLGIYDISKPAQAETDHEWKAALARRELRARRASVRFRWPLRLHFADDRRLHRQHRDDPRSQGSRQAGRSRPLVDAGPVDCRRRDADLEKRRASCHHPLRFGNRLYTSYWQGGLVILDIDDMTKPKFVSGLDWSPPFPWPTHTALRIPFKIKRRDFMLVSDEDVFRQPDFRRIRPRSCGWWTSRTRSTRNPSRLSRSRTCPTAAAAHDRLPSAVRSRHRHRNSGGVVRLWPARNRHIEPARA